MALRSGLLMAYKNVVKPSLQMQNSIIGNKLFATLTKDVKEKIDGLVANHKVVVFMKGDPSQPRCGFSNAVVQVFRMHGVQYEAHDVLSSEELRNGIKEYTSWPTIPQIFIDGEFIGGCDILLEKHQNGELIDDLQKIGIKSALLEKELSKEK